MLNFLNDFCIFWNHFLLYSVNVINTLNFKYKSKIKLLEYTHFGYITYFIYLDLVY